MHTKPPFDWIAPPGPAVAPELEPDLDDPAPPRPELRLVPDSPPPTGRRNRDMPRLCASCQAPMASKATECESCGTPWKS
jgi:hypothetical protein